MFLTYRRAERPIQMLDAAHHLLNGPRSELCDGSIASRMTMKLRCDKDEATYVSGDSRGSRCLPARLPRTESLRLLQHARSKRRWLFRFRRIRWWQGRRRWARSAQCQTKQPRHLPQGKHLGQAGDDKKWTAESIVTALNSRGIASRIDRFPRTRYR
jgi:hypothetical protein